MIDHSNYSCDKCAREFSRHCNHCLHTADNPPTRFERKKKMGTQVPPQYTPPPMPPIKPPKTMYGLKLYIPFNDLDKYIHDHVEDVYKDHTFIPVKVEINEIGLDIEISLVSAVPVECDKRYKLDINKLSKEAIK